MFIFIKSKTRQLAVLLCFASLIIGCASTVPLPSNITFVEPSPDMPEELSAFQGIWKGQWDRTQDTKLVIERINRDYAEIIFSVGFFQPPVSRLHAIGLKPENAFYYARGEIINNHTLGWSTSNGNTFIFEMQDGLDKIEGHFIDNSTNTKIEATLVRADEEGLSGIEFHRFPYIEYGHPLKTRIEFEHDNTTCWKRAEKQTVLLSPDIRRFRILEEVDRCLQDDFQWEHIKDDTSHIEIRL